MRRKAFKKEAFYELTNCIASAEGAPRWSEVFEVARPTTVELGCGRGDFALGLAAGFPERNIIGVDVKRDRLWAAGERALEQNLTNLRFLCAKIERIAELFPPAEVGELWITFPDPYPKIKHSERRLTSPAFIEKYRKILAPNGTIYLKTDNVELFDYSLKILNQLGLSPFQSTYDVHGSPEFFPNDLKTNPLEILTFYERRFMAQGKKIAYLAFRF